MPPIQPPRQAVARFIIRSDDHGQLAEFIKNANDDPDIEMIDSIGPAGQPHTVVVAMSAEKASSLEQRFRNAAHLKIEPDRPLSLFGDATGG